MSHWHIFILLIRLEAIHKKQMNKLMALAFLLFFYTFLLLLKKSLNEDSPHFS